MSKILDLAKKLKALSDRGVGGEKENAQQMLAELIEKHGISIDEIEEPERKQEVLDCKIKQKEMMGQVAYMVLGSKARVYESTRNKNCLVVECTKAEYLEIEASFEFFWRAYEKELKLFYQAFIQKNRIFSGDVDGRELKDLTEQELKDLRRVMGMKDSIDKYNLNKMLIE